MKTVVATITPDSLPDGLQWEQDGACWRAERDNYAPEGWRWSPRNAKAIAKDCPEGPMVDHVSFRAPEPKKI